MISYKIEALVKEFPEKLTVKNMDNFLQNSFDIHYESPKRSLVPCSHKCIDKTKCAHDCCHNYAINVKVNCTDRSGESKEHFIVLKEEPNKVIVYFLYLHYSIFKLNRSK